MNYPFLLRNLIAALFAIFAATRSAPAQELSAPDITRPSFSQIYLLQSQLETLPTAPGVGLIQPLPPRNAPADRALASEPVVARMRLGLVEPDYLDALMTGPDLQMSNDGRIIGTPRTYVLNLFDDVTVKLVKIDMERDVLGHDVWQGAVVGPESGEAILVMDQGRITGKIRVGGRSFGIQPAENGLHTVIEYDEASLPVVDDDTQIESGAPPLPTEEQTPPPPLPSGEPRDRAAAVTNLNLLVVYTPRALTLRPNITADISLFIKSLNTTLSNSNSNVQVSLVGTQQVNYTESSSATMSTILDDARDGASDFARIAQLRASMQADLVQVWGVSTDACGLANMNDYFDTAGGNLGYYARYTTSFIAVSTSGGCTNTAYDAPTHEIGHNLGAQHDRYAQNLQGSKNTAGPQGYNYGYIDATANFSDVMAYGSQSAGSNLCNDQGISCPHIPYFSNPNVTYNGRPVGVSDSQTTAANNARRIGEIAPYILQLRPFFQQPRLGLFFTGSGTVSGTGGVNCTTTCSTSNFTAGQEVTLTATPANGWNFSGWGNSGECTSSTITATRGTCTLVMNGWAYAYPTFTQGASQFGLTVSRTGAGGGSVTSSPSGINCGTICTANYTSGTQVTLTATPLAGSTFNGWTNGCSGTGTCSVTMTTASSVTATFNLAQTSSPVLTVSVTGSGSVTSTPSGINCGSACSATYTSGTQVTLTATPGANSTFTGWGGGVCSGTGSCSVTMSTARNVTAAFTSSQTSTQVVTVNVTGSGTVTSSPSGFNCRSSCTASFITGSQVTLSAAPSLGWQFIGWNNTCPGTSTCTITANPGISVSAIFIQPTGSTVSLGSIYSTSQSAIQSFLRFYNTGGTPGLTQLTLSSDVTGAALAQWTSPAIPAGASRQFSLDEIERGTGQSFSKPDNYRITVQPQMSGYLQHVLYRPSDGTLTNLSTCNAGVTANATQLINVHSSILDFGFPSTVVVNNSGTTTASVVLGLYDAATGAKLGNGSYSVPAIPAGGQSRVLVATMEAAIGISPSSSNIYQYIIKSENQFTGFLQHLVSNLRVGVITDMTTVCSLSAVKAATVSTVRLSSIYSTSQSAIQSFLRFHNTGATAGTVRVTLNSDTSGSMLAQWTSPSIAAGSSRQFSIDEVERGTGQNFTKPGNYSLTIQPQMSGYAQHVLYRPSDGTLTNLSTCDTGVTANPSQLINVHSSILDSGFPSTVGVNNTGTASASVTLGIYNATTGTRLGSGTYATATIPAGGQSRVGVATMEAALGISPSAAGIYHYVIKVEGSFTGYLQHLVNNRQAGVITDMTTVCALSNDDVSPDSIATQGQATIGVETSGTINSVGDRDWFRVSLTAGRAYTADLFGSPSSNGTLADPQLRIMNSAGNQVAENDDKATTHPDDSQVTFTPATSGDYFLVAAAYDDAETGTYRVLIAPNQDDVSPDTIDTNGRATIAVESRGTINSNGDRDWFRISLTAGQTYIVDLMGATSSRGTLVDPYLRIMNSSGSQVAANDDKSSGCCESQITFTATATGNYFLVAGDDDDSGTGTYVLVARQQTIGSTTLRFEGAYSFNITYGVTATLRADRIVNPSTTRTTGTLRLELWYLAAPYTGSGGSGYRVAQTTLGTLAPGAAFTSVSQTVTPLVTPPAGTYYPVLFLTEFSSTCTASDGYCTAAYVNMTPAQQL